jgi:hypothetical protein
MSPNSGQENRTQPKLLKCTRMLLEVANAILPSPVWGAPAGRLAKLGIDHATALEHKDVGLTLWVADHCVFPGGASRRPKDDVADLAGHGPQSACTTTTEEIDDGQKDDCAQQRNQ